MGHYVKNNASHDNMRIGYVRRSKLYYFSNYPVIIMCNYSPFAHVLWSVVLHKRPGTYHLRNTFGIWLFWLSITFEYRTKPRHILLWLREISIKTQPHRITILLKRASHHNIILIISAMYYYVSFSPAVT